MQFQVHEEAILWEDSIKKLGAAGPSKMHTLTDMLPSPVTKKYQSFLGITIYLGNFFSSTAEVCKQLRGLTSTKTGWMYNNISRNYMSR